jgi:hypothetical protein
MKVCPAVLELLHVERPTDGHGEAITLSFCKILLRLRRGPDKSDNRVLGVSCGRIPFSVVTGGYHIFCFAYHSNKQCD